MFVRSSWTSGSVLVTGAASGLAHLFARAVPGEAELREHLRAGQEVDRGEPGCGQERASHPGGVARDAVEDDCRQALVEAVERALALYEEGERFREVRRFDMACDFSIERCARSYAKLYEEML